jgi:RNA polymerase sigma-70 factor (ECF subfamily)
MMTMARNSQWSRDKEAGLCGLADRECIALARGGHRGAQAELVNRHLPVVYRLCLRLTCDRESAADATQEVFVRALGAIGSLDPESSVRAWLCAIACNLVRDLSRRAKVRRIVPAPRGEDGEPRELHDERQQPVLEVLARKEEARLLEEAFARLDPEARAIVVLRDIEGLSYGEIAQALQVRLGTVKSRVHRARMELKDAMLALRPACFDA